jgi:Uncharacterized protein conserved in bacteria (DUF2314)
VSFDAGLLATAWVPRRVPAPESESTIQELRMPSYERGDYVKVEFQDENTVISEWMWVRVHHCDDEKQLVFGTLDNEPVNDYGQKVKLGLELAVSYAQIREHKKASDFTSKN